MMTTLLIADDNPGGQRTEDVLRTIRADVIERMQRYSAQPTREATQVLENNITILSLLTQAIHLAEANTRILYE